ncbi:putative Ig domain-containing protein, partial [Sphingobacterium daejeonense]
DIDSDKLKYEIIDNQYDWLKFNPNKLKISGTPIKVGTFEVTISAKDKHGNSSNGTITFTVVD